MKVTEEMLDQVQDEILDFWINSREFKEALKPFFKRETLSHLEALANGPEFEKIREEKGRDAARTAAINRFVASPKGEAEIARATRSFLRSPKAEEAFLEFLRKRDPRRHKRLLNDLKKIDSSGNPVTP